MAHFAEIDHNNTVQRVVVVANDLITDEFGVEVEELGAQYLRGVFGEHTTWIQTSYNGNFRRQYAAVQGKYDPVDDVFVDPMPTGFPSFVLVNGKWIPPYQRPDFYTEETWPSDLGEFSAHTFVWNEQKVKWDIVVLRARP